MKTYLWLLAAVLVFGGGCVAGTGVEPRTEFSYGVFGFKFVDTKDNDVNIEGFRRDQATGAVEFDKLVIRNNSSDVMTANVAQMMALNEQLKTHGENLNRLVGHLVNLLPKVLPGVSVDGPLGGSVDVNPAAIEAIVEGIINRRAASQPSE